ncbi:MAG: SLC13 family permease [Candidatus Brocadiaceae bacterium]|nr:SLC13 family permease [Candidatus Brocadiaceae bacterium]
MSLDILLVFTILLTTIILFVTEFIRIDVTALLVLILLTIFGLIPTEQAFSGFASNAVISIIAVMILGYGLDQSGVMNRVIKGIFRLTGKSECRLFCVTSSMIGIISAFMQNIGVITLFLPALIKMTKRMGITPSRFFMPMGFSAILGGTLSMIGSSPLILLNDLMEQGGLEKFTLFSVTPIGAVLFIAGVSFFLLFGNYVLPARPLIDIVTKHQQELISSWDLPKTFFELIISNDSPLIGKTRETVKLKEKYGLYLIALGEKEEIFYAPWRQAGFSAGQRLGILGSKENVERFASDYHLRISKYVTAFDDLQKDAIAGFAEVIVKPHSSIIGKTLREIAMRKTYGVEPLILFSGGIEARSGFSDNTLTSGDTIIVYGHWKYIEKLSTDGNFVVITPIRTGDTTSSKELTACICFLSSLVMAVSGVHLPLALFAGALAMILFRVIRIDDAYKAIDWQTVFLLAGLIPLGLAMKQTGAAEFIARTMMHFLEGKHIIVLLFAIAALTTVFTLLMSNVAATILLAPLVIDIGKMVSVDPRYLALVVGICASNSFLLPTHQVNALLIVPGKYRNQDYLKAGGIMTLIFLCITVCMIYVWYL